MSQFVFPETWRSPGTLRHAVRLLGLYLVRRDGSFEDARMITEVEAYDSEKDLACHARFGRTPRSEPLYAAGGIWYVYLCYGVHEMLNLVVGPEIHPAALLIRSVEGINGPGRLTKALRVRRDLNRCEASPACGLYLEDRGVRVPRRMIRRTPRIGVNYAGPVWAHKPWRFTFDPKPLPAPHAAPAQG